MGLPVGVICPKRAIPKWEAMLREFRVDTLFVLNPEKLQTGSTPYLKKVGSKFEWVHRRALLIFDEGHQYGGNGTLNARMLAAAEGIPTLVLSATIAESPLQLRALGYRLGLHNDRDFWRWSQRYGVRKGYFGGLEFDPESEEGIDGMKRLHDSIFPHRGFRVDESESSPSRIRKNGRPRKRTVKIDEVVMDSLTWQTTKNLEAIAQALADMQERVEEVASLRRSINQLRSEVVRANKAVMMALCKGVEPDTWESLIQNEGITFRERIK